MWNGVTVAVMWNMLCFEMWWCEMVVRGRLWCNVVSDVVCSKLMQCGMLCNGGGMYGVT